MLDRAQAVLEARRWIGTPYVLGGRVCGSGCDCATILAEYLIAIGACLREDLGLYSHDWFCHATEERYLLALMRHASKTIETVATGKQQASPGDIVLLRLARSRVYNHGAIVTAWPLGIHAARGGAKEIDLRFNPLTSHMPMAIFDPWAKAGAKAGAASL